MRSLTAIHSRDMVRTLVVGSASIPSRHHLQENIARSIATHADVELQVSGTRRSSFPPSVKPFPDLCNVAKAYRPLSRVVYVPIQLSAKWISEICRASEKRLRV